MTVKWKEENKASGEIEISYSTGDYKLVDGSWWRCTDANIKVARWESVDPPEFVKDEYRSVDAIRKLNRG